jgi:hypothetical protein
MTQAYSTLRVGPGDDGVLGVVIDSPLPQWPVRALAFQAVRP